MQRYRYNFYIFAGYRMIMKRETQYQKIAKAIASQIKKGVWRVGEKLPSLRAVSHENGVSLNTAIQAYYELEKDGYIISRPKSGYIVDYKPIRLSAPATTQPSLNPEGKEVADLIAEVYSSLEIGDKSITRFSLGMPEDVLLPITKLNKELIRAMRSLPGNGTRYDETQGNIRLRKYVAHFTYSWNGYLTEDDHFPENTKVVTPQGGFMLWMELDKQIDTTKLNYRAMQQRISIAPGRMFTLQDQYNNCMRLSYGQRWTPFIEERFKQLGDIIKKSL